MSERAEFHVRGEPLDGTPLHYTASGLDYVYLRNGFTIEDDPDYGRIVTITNEQNLHTAIGMYVIMQPRALRSAEFRYLRKLMGFKQKELAEELGVNEQTVANYEKNKRIPGTSDRLMRTIFLLWITPEDARADLIKRINDAMKGQRSKKPGSPPSTDIQGSIATDWRGQPGVDPMPTCHAY